jgi:hypothetical protein
MWHRCAMRRTGARPWPQNFKKLLGMTIDKVEALLLTKERKTTA